MKIGKVNCMEGESYRVVLLGIESGGDPRLVKERVMRIFHASPEKVEKLFSKLPVTVKSGADFETARKYHDVLRGAGCVCRMESVDGPPSAPAGASATTVATCPGCGYEAKTPDDPLITAHGGLGECPVCGIIVAKFAASRTTPDVEPPAVPEVADAGEKPPSAVKRLISLIISRPWMSLLMVAAVVTLVINMFFMGDSKKEGKGAKPAASPAQGGNAAPGGNPRAAAASLIILPGEDKDVRMTTYLDYLHRDTFSPLTIKISPKIDNKWEKDGVRVEIRSVNVTPVSVTLWEHRRPRDDVWAPAGYSRISSLGSSSGMVEKGKNLLSALAPAALVKNPDATTVKIDPESPDFRKSAYTMYRVEYELSMAVPSGEQFARRDNIEIVTSEGKAVQTNSIEKNVCITPLIQWELDSAAEALMPSRIPQNGPWKATKAATLSSKTNCIRMAYSSGREGLHLSPVDVFPEMPGFLELEMP